VCRIDKIGRLAEHFAAQAVDAEQLRKRIEEKMDHDDMLFRSLGESS